MHTCFLASGGGAPMEVLALFNSCMCPTFGESTVRQQPSRFFPFSSLCCSYFKTSSEQGFVSERSDQRDFISMVPRNVFPCVLAFCGHLNVPKSAHTWCSNCFGRICFSTVSSGGPTLLFMSRPRRRGEFGFDLRNVNHI